MTAQALLIHDTPPLVSFPHDGCFYEVDFTSLLEDPAAVGIALRARKNFEGPEIHQFGVDCDSWTIPFWLRLLHSRGVGDVVVRLIDGKVWLRATNDNVEVYLLAEFRAPGAFFYDSPVNVTPTTGAQVNVWRSVNVHPLETGDNARDVEAALVQCVHTGPTQGQWSARRYKSTYAETFKSETDWAYQWVTPKATLRSVYGVGTPTIEVYSAGTAKPFEVKQSLFIPGYILKGYGFEAAFDPFELDLQVDGAWTTIERPAGISSLATGVLGRIENRQPIIYAMGGLRKPGTTGLAPDIEHGFHNASAVAALATDGSLDYFLENPVENRIEILGATVEPREGGIEAEISIEPRVRGGLELEPAVDADCELEPAVSAVVTLEDRVAAEIEIEP